VALPALAAVSAPCCGASAAERRLQHSVNISCLSAWASAHRGKWDQLTPLEKWMKN